LSDALREPARCFGEVAGEPHLFFQVGEDAFDHEPAGGERVLAVLVGGGALPRGC